jgi:hypothetical protein
MLRYLACLIGFFALIAVLPARGQAPVPQAPIEIGQAQSPTAQTPESQAGDKLTLNKLTLNRLVGRIGGILARSMHEESTPLERLL